MSGMTRDELEELRESVVGLHEMAMDIADACGRIIEDLNERAESLPSSGSGRGTGK